MKVASLWIVARHVCAQAASSRHKPSGAAKQGGQARADVVSIFPNEGAIVRLISAVMLDANDEWQLQRRCLQTGPMAELMLPPLETVTPQIATVAA